jgi:hypothetical protein
MRKDPKTLPVAEIVQDSIVKRKELPRIQKSLQDENRSGITALYCIIQSAVGRQAPDRDPFRDAWRQQTRKRSNQHGSLGLRAYERAYRAQ